MILDSTDHLALYRGLSKNLDEAIDYLLKADLNALPIGRADVSERIYVNRMKIEYRAAEAVDFERHRDYIDIQLPLSQEEHIGVLPVNAPEMKFGVYDAEKDIAFAEYQGMGSDLRMTPKMFCILFPDDAHKPGVGAGRGDKAVVKVRV